ncbi:hypothetical protein [Actinokineospora iranica]|uniref:Uncharacterized protein n=1 Tax=Actinokineospora iranica TaxID=1271860 RepID=A0A1G6P1C8_9PSEU|nr:hypothetical protein [Actinokineospora iranica]SDC73404.1 hypothetical protein SAMN05216174_10441 [Actinokineospora iranica]
MDHSAPLGAGLVGRLRVCGPGERLLWASYRQVFYFDVEGLDPLGAPRKNAMSRGALAFGRGVGEFVLTGVGEVLFGGGDESGNDKPPAADHLVFGPGPGCLAHQAVPGIGAEPGKRMNRLWVLTTARLAVAAPRPVPEPEPEAPKSLLGKAVGFGKGVLDVSRDIAKIVTDNRRKYGANIEGEPVAVPDLVQVADFPRALIASVQVVNRKRDACLRVSFIDGSGVDFILDQDSAHHAVELSGGTR